MGRSATTGTRKDIGRNATDAAKRASWRDVELRLREAILRSDFGIGDRIPTEPELMAAYGSSRYAVRRALTQLQKDGMIRIEQGRGTFVHDDHLVSYRLGERPRFTNVLIEDQITPGQEILRIKTVPAESSVTDALGMTLGEGVLLMELLGYANGEVVKHDTNYFPLPRFEGFEVELRNTRSVTEALATRGVVDYRRKSTSIIGRLPSPTEARLLRQLPASPVFEILRTDIDGDDVPILFGITIFSCTRVRLILAA